MTQDIGLLELKEVTPQQYAKYKGISVQFIYLLVAGLRQDKRNWLGDIKEIKHYSRFYLFMVDKSLKI